MARVIARRDLEARYVFFRSGDGFNIPGDARDLLKRNGGDFSGETKEWRVPLARGAGVVDSLRVDGHTVVTVDANDRRPTVTALECRNCAKPYSSRSNPAPGSMCAACNAPLELVPPHVCGPECSDRARSANASA